MSRALALALRTLGREWRSGELGVLLLALTIAVAALTGVGFLVGRIGAAVDQQASEVLAADVRLGSPQPISDTYFNEATRRGIRSGVKTRPYCPRTTKSSDGAIMPAAARTIPSALTG